MYVFIYLYLGGSTHVFQHVSFPLISWWRWPHWYTPENWHDIATSSCSIGNTPSNGGFSIVMLFFGGVCFPCLSFNLNPSIITIDWGCIHTLHGDSCWCNLRLCSTGWCSKRGCAGHDGGNYHVWSPLVQHLDSTAFTILFHLFACNLVLWTNIHDVFVLRGHRDKDICVSRTILERNVLGPWIL